MELHAPTHRLLSSVIPTHILRSTNLKELHFNYQQSRSCKLANLTGLKVLARECQAMKGRFFELFISTAEELTGNDTKIASCSGYGRTWRASL